MNKLLFIVVLTVLSQYTEAFNILDLFKIISNAPHVNFNGIIEQLEPANINITIVRSKVRSNEDLEKALDSIANIARNSGILHVIDNVDRENQTDRITDLNIRQDNSNTDKTEIK